jgi:hypothetical protein
VRYSWSKAHAGPSSVRPIHSCSSRSQFHSLLRVLGRQTLSLSRPRFRCNSILAMLPCQAGPHWLLLSVDSPGVLICPALPLLRATLRQHLLRTGWDLRCNLPGVGTRGVRRLVILGQAMDRRSSNPRRTSATIVSRVPPFSLSHSLHSHGPA